MLSDISLAVLLGASRLGESPVRPRKRENLKLTLRRKGQGGVFDTAVGAVMRLQSIQLNFGETSA